MQGGFFKRWKWKIFNIFRISYRGINERMTDLKHPIYFVSVLLLCLEFFLPDYLLASPVKQEYKGLIVNAEFVEAQDKQKPFLIILHGTFAWNGMELPKTLQSLLADEGYGSLAMTLSLGESNRTGFFDCQHKIISRHQDAEQEISFWVNYVEKLGYRNLVLVAHSRGGAQATTYALKHPKKIDKLFLIAPMTWDKSVTKEIARPSSKQTVGDILKEIRLNKPTDLTKVNGLHCKNAVITSLAFQSYYSEFPIKDSPTLLSKINLPTRVYLGDMDRLITESFNRKSHLFEKNKQVSLLTIEDADHFFRDFAVEDIVADMLKRLE